MNVYLQQNTDCGNLHAVAFLTWFSLETQEIPVAFVVMFAENFLVQYTRWHFFFFNIYLCNAYFLGYASPRWLGCLQMKIFRLMLSCAMYRQIHRNCPQRRTPSLNVGSISRIYQHTAPKRGSASRIHQHTAPQKGVHLQNSSTYSPPKGVCLQNSSTKGGRPLDFINQMGVRLQNSSTST